ncbi:MAG TPA: hypothetical protein EYG57_15045 [Planctomycetes bacterium]|jgi:hypothetical protein|nr:hypothetical protein [Planctomycetota bacterium]
MDRRQATLPVQAEFAFDGETYDPHEDYERLNTSLDRVRWLMAHPTGRWWTLRALSDRTGSSEAGVSARIRDLRKPRNGGLVVEHERQAGGLWHYRVTRI